MSSDMIVAHGYHKILGCQSDVQKPPAKGVHLMHMHSGIEIMELGSPIIKAIFDLCKVSSSANAMMH